MDNWYWIELIGFDNEKPDFGVKQFIDNVGAKIEGISLLFSDIGFVISQGLSRNEYKLRPCDCSYNAHEYSEERRRQEWTNAQLKALIKEIKRHKIKVLFSFFNQFSNEDVFFQKEIQLADFDKSGKIQNSISMIKRLNDGSFFEDLLIDRIKEVALYYGFDGIQVADGVSSPRPSILNGDFSDDIVGQFLVWTDNPMDIAPETKSKRDYIARRKYIIENHYYEFVQFLSDRWASFYKKVLDGLKKENLLLIFNNCWTREPFEAKYRYGFDYKKIEDGRIDAVMFEDVSATQSIFSDEDQGGFRLEDERVREYIHYEYVLASMRLKMALPKTRLLALSPVRDTQEQWDVFRHAPMEMEREMSSRNNTFVFLDGFEKAISGNFFCLCDSMKKSDWETISRIIDKSGPDEIEGAIGFSSVWSDEKIDRELKYYIETRNYTTPKIEHELVKGGLPVCAMVICENLGKVDMPLLVCNYDFYSGSEKAAIRSAKNPVLVIGKGCPEEFKKVIMDGLYIGFNNIDADIEGIGKALKGFKIKKCRKGEDYAGAIWTAPLKYNGFSEKFFYVLARLCNRHFNLPESLDPSCKIRALKLKGGRIRFLLSNDDHRYILPKINVKAGIKSAKSLTKYRGYKVTLIQSESSKGDPDIFISRVPPKGMEIVEVET